MGCWRSCAGSSPGSPASSAPRSACSRRRCRCSRSSPCSRSRPRRCGTCSGRWPTFDYFAVIGLFVDPRLGLPRRPRPARGAPARARGRRRRPAADPGPALQRRPRPLRQPGGPGADRQPHDRRLLRPLRPARGRRRPSRSSGWASPASTLVSFSLGGTDFQLTTELLRVAGGLAAFSGFYFAVAMLTDSTYREEFLEELTDEMSASFKARAEYLRLRTSAPDRHNPAPDADRARADDDPRLPPPPRQPLRLDRAAQPVRAITASRCPRRWRSASAPASAST